MNAHIHFSSYLAEFFLEWQMFQTKVVDKIKTHILYSITFSQQLCHLWDNVEKYCVLHAGYQRLQTHTHNVYYVLLFHCNSGCMNAPHFYVVRTLPVLCYIQRNIKPAWSAFSFTRCWGPLLYQCAHSY